MNKHWYPDKNGNSLLVMMEPFTVQTPQCVKLFPGHTLLTGINLLDCS